MRISGIFMLAAACTSAPREPALRMVGMPAPSLPPGEALPRWTFASPVVAREQSDVRILMYHSFGWFSEMRPAVTPHALRTQLDWLTLNGFSVAFPILEQRGIPFTLALFYPLGAHDERVRRATERAGYRAGFAARGGRVAHDSPRFALPRYEVEQSTHLFTFAHYFRHRGKLPR